jgi:hypothetical protein
MVMRTQPNISGRCDVCRTVQLIPVRAVDTLRMCDSCQRAAEVLALAGGPMGATWIQDDGRALHVETREGRTYVTVEPACGNVPDNGLAGMVERMLMRAVQS